MDFLQELNTEQYKAATNYKGPTLIIAGAGSGKTRVLTYRIAHMLNQNIAPYKVLSLTFTNKAAAEMKERIGIVVGKEVANKIWMGTFHSVFAKILRTEAEHIGYKSSFTIYDTTDTKSVLNSIIKEMNLDEKVYKVAAVYARISLAKNSLVQYQAYVSNAQLIEADKQSRMPYIFEIYKRYAQKCFAANAMDFDDLLLNTNVLFRDHPEVLAKYQDKFQYILVDEYQDTNFAQYLIIKKLSAKHNNICVVGDDSQSIYSFRGAKIQNILNFKTDYPNFSLYKLEQNYRSSQNIVNAANSLIEKNRNRIPKNVWSQNPEGEKIKVTKCYTDSEEGYAVASTILDSQYNNKFAFNDFAILYRTNAQSRIFEEAFRKRNIPYKIYGGLSFYQRKEIKDIIAYFRLIINTSDEEAFKRIINYPKRGLGDTTVNKILEYSLLSQKSSWSAINNLDNLNLGFNAGTVSKLKSFVLLINELSSKLYTLNAYDYASEIIAKTGIHSELFLDKTPEGVSRYENVQELLNGLREFCENYYEEDLPTLDKYIENVSLLTDVDNEKDEDRNKVTLMTVHSAKGLEFEHIFIVGAEENLFPSQRSSSTADDLEEERRLFYVAVTRAKKLANISYAQTRFKYGNYEQCIPSRFIREIDIEYLTLPVDDSFAHETATSTMEDPRKKSFGSFKQTPERPVFSQPKNLTKISRLSNNSGSGSSNESYEIGTLVEHDRFGVGEIISIEGSGANTKATVNFRDHGSKSLLLKFARLKVVE